MYLKITPHVLKYGYATVINTVVSYLMFLLLSVLKTPQTLLFILIYTLCPLFNHWMYANTVYQSKKKNRFFYCSFYFTLFLINNLLIDIMRQYVNLYVAQFLCLVSIGFISIIFNNLFFRGTHKTHEI